MQMDYATFLEQCLQHEVDSECFEVMADERFNRWMADGGQGVLFQNRTGKHATWMKARLSRAPQERA